MKRLNDAQKISRLLLNAIEQFNKYDKKARTFGTGQELFIAEIHLIDFIGNNPDCWISDIAKSMQVTKGAVSQVVKKLEKKGYVAKTDDAENKAKVIVQLTERGRIAFEGHQQFHNNIDKKIFSIIDSYSEKDCRAICTFLQTVQEDWK